MPHRFVMKSGWPKPTLIGEIARNEGYLEGFRQDMGTAGAHPLPKDGFVGMEIMGKMYAEKEAAGAAVLDACRGFGAGREAMPIGEYRGFRMELSFDSMHKEFEITLKGKMSHRASLGTDARGNITRLDNCLSNMGERMRKVEETLDDLRRQEAAAREESARPFPKEAELKEKSGRLSELDAMLNMDGPDVPAVGITELDEAEDVESVEGADRVDGMGNAGDVPGRKDWETTGNPGLAEVAEEKLAYGGHSPGSPSWEGTDHRNNPAGRKSVLAQLKGLAGRVDDHACAAQGRKKIVSNDL